jgi:hypothetical protein
MDFGLVVFDDEAIDSGLQLDNQDEDPAPPSLVGGVVVEDKMGNPATVERLLPSSACYA